MIAIAALPADAAGVLTEPRNKAWMEADRGRVFVMGWRISRKIRLRAAGQCCAQIEPFFAEKLQKRMTKSTIGAPTPATSDRTGAAGQTVLWVVGYLVIYIALDWLSSAQELPGVGFSMWNPPPALSLALLLRKGLRFAPALAIAGVGADVVDGRFPLGVPATLASDVVIAVVYVGVAAVLRRFIRPEHGLQSVEDVVWLLVISGLGTLAVASAAVASLVAMHAMPEGLAFISTRHYFIGDLTGVVGLLPVLLTMPQARQRWRDTNRKVRLLDVGLFLLGLALALVVIFGLAGSNGQQFFYFLIPPVVWISVRHGMAWSPLAILAEQIAVIVAVIALDFPTADFLDYQVLLLVVAVTGLILGAVVTERQRTERLLRERQAELSRTGRLTMAGALGASVVHELSQPVATVATYVHACRRLLRSEPYDFELLRQTLGTVESEVRRAGAIIERLRDFLGKSEPRWSLIDLVEVVRQVVAVLDDDARAHGVTVLIEAERLPQIAADRIQIEQVLVNLIGNALEAIAENGRPGRLRIDLRRQGKHVEIAFEDDGPGVAVDVALRLFEPFETSKRRGMGLGLALSREIAIAHGGVLWWDASTMTGARFVLRLPCDGIKTP